MHARSPKHAKPMTTHPIYTPTDDPPMRPEWIRVDDTIRIFGISRSKIYELLRERKVKTFCLRQRNKLKGIRLINYDSINQFMEGEAAVQEAEHLG
jgi:hypothetical protein